MINMAGERSTTDRGSGGKSEVGLMERETAKVDSGSRSMAVDGTFAAGRGVGSHSNAFSSPSGIGVGCSGSGPVGAGLGYRRSVTSFPSKIRLDDSGRRGVVGGIVVPGLEGR